MYTVVTLVGILEVLLLGLIMLQSIVLFLCGKLMKGGINRTVEA
jgi:hypothetical protein